VNASTHEVKATQTATPVLVQAVEPAPGLRIYVYPEELRGPDSTYLWRLGHHSGLQIGKFEHQSDAEAAAEAIAPLADWTRGAAELKADGDLATKVYMRIAFDTPGIFTANA
jgi:hypothetical protein